MSNQLFAGPKVKAKERPITQGQTTPGLTMNKKREGEGVNEPVCGGSRELLALQGMIVHDKARAT